MSEYILDLRKTVGHRPLLQVGASVIVVDSEGRILLQKRRDNGRWGYAGGSVELDEEVEKAAMRELFEETGLFANELELFGVFREKSCITPIRTATRFQILILFTFAAVIPESLRRRQVKCRSCVSFPPPKCRPKTS